MGENQTRADGANDTRENVGRILDHLYRFAGVVGSNLDVATLFEDALSFLQNMVGAERILAVLLRRGSENGSTIKQKGFGKLPDIAISKTVLAELGTEAFGCGSTRELPRGLEVLEDTGGHLAVVPLSAYGRQMGVLVLSRKAESFTAEDLKLLNTAGRQLGLAVENSRLFGDLQESYRKLMDAQEELIQSERLAALGGLAATMAHEIRNPLATIFSSLSQIRKHARIEGDSATLLEIAEEEAIRLNRMVGGLLEFARPRTPRIGEVRPADVAREVVHAVSSHPEFPEGVKISVSEENNDILASLDPELFRRTLDHLVANAVAAVDPREGVVEIFITPRSDENSENGIDVIIRDNGPGIPKEIQGDIFEPFFSTKPSGIGLGLPVVRRIVEDHRGVVTIESKPGLGTVVRLSFRPMAKGDPAGGLKL